MLEQTAVDELWLATEVDVVSLGLDAGRDDLLAKEAVGAGGIHDDSRARAHGDHRARILQVGHHDAHWRQAVPCHDVVELGLRAARNGPPRASPRAARRGHLGGRPCHVLTSVARRPEDEHVELASWHGSAVCLARRRACSHCARTERSVNSTPLVPAPPTESQNTHFHTHTVHPTVRDVCSCPGRPPLLASGRASSASLFT